MRYGTLMKKVEDGDIEIIAWELKGNHVDAIVYPNDLKKRPIRKVIKVTNIPKNIDR